MQLGQSAASIAVGISTLFAAGCMSNAPAGDLDASVVVASADGGIHTSSAGPDLAAADLAVTNDLAVITLDMSHGVLDLAATDLSGLFNCYGRAICDPNMDFCLKFHSGSPAVPGTVNAPACFTPATPCADNGEAMGCDCIQNDDSLGVACQGSCVDNLDGTFDCYAKSDP